MKENSVLLMSRERTKNNSDSVLSYIQENPGSHLRGIERGLSISLGTLRYHLDTLEKTGKIMSERYNLHRYYFLAGSFKEDERNTLKMLNKKTSRRIILFIMERKNPTLKDIVKNIGISYASVTWHIRRFIDLGIILEFDEGRYRKYHLVTRSQDIANLFKNYHNEEWNNWADNLVDRFLSL